MRKRKEFSKCCTMCGEVWNTDMSNKVEGRALCIPCGVIDNRATRARYNELRSDEPKKIDLMQPFKVVNREKHWLEVNRQIKPLKKLEDIHAFIVKQADEVFANKELMEFINHQK